MPSPMRKNLSLWGNKQSTTGRGWEGGHRSPGPWHGHGAGNSRSCPLGVAHSPGKLSIPMGFQ